MTSITSCKIMVWGISGAIVGAVIYFGGTLSDPESQAFFQTSEFTIWFLINEVLFALYPILLVFFIQPIQKLKEQPDIKQPEIIVSSFLLTGLFFIPLLIGAKVINMQPLPFVNADQKIKILEGVGFFASALPISVCIWLTQAAIRKAFGESFSEGDIQKYLDFRDQLHRYLAILGALLSLFILASAALRSAAIATGATTAGDYPPIYLLFMGAFYTSLTALVYFPAQQTLSSAGYRLLDDCFPIPEPDSVDWSMAYSNRKNLEELLELKITVEERIATSVTLLAPFFSSIFSLLIE